MFTLYNNIYSVGYAYLKQNFQESMVQHTKYINLVHIYCLEKDLHGLKYIALQFTHLFSKVLYRLSFVLTKVEGETLSSKTLYQSSTFQNILMSVGMFNFYDYCTDFMSIFNRKHCCCIF